MVQGGGKKLSKRPGEIKKSAGKSAKVVKHMKKQQMLKKGAPVQLPKNRYLNAALEDRDLSKAIDKANEQKVAAKVIGDGGKLKLTDIIQKGKEFNREKKREELKKKVGRVQEKLKELEAKAEEKGLI